MTGTNFTAVQNENVNLVLLAGGNISFALNFLEDTTNYTAEMCLKANKNSEPVATFTIANSRVVIGGSNGLITFQMDKDDRNALPAITNGYYAISVYNGSIWLPEIWGRLDAPKNIC